MDGWRASIPIVAESGLEVDRGKATVNEYLQSTSHDDVFVVGDSAVAFPPEGGRPYAPTAQNAWQMGELVGYNLFAYLNDKTLENLLQSTLVHLQVLDVKMLLLKWAETQLHLKALPASLIKEASNLRYLSHIKGLFALAY